MRSLNKRCDPDCSPRRGQFDSLLCARYSYPNRGVSMTDSARAITLLLAIPLLTLAQSFTASVRGVITDSSQSAVPGAKVVITDVDRNVPQEATTDSAGRYVITPLPPGRYSLSVEPTGFNKYTPGEFP